MNLEERDFIRRVMGHPSLRGIARDEILKAIYSVDRDILPQDVQETLRKSPLLTIRATDPEEIKRIIRVANREASTSSLGLSAKDYHYVRTTLSMHSDREMPLDWGSSIGIFDGQVIPRQEGMLLDITPLDSMEVDEELMVVRAGVGAKWKDVYDKVAEKGYLLPIFPSVPLDYSILDSFGGDATFRSFFGGMQKVLRNVRLILPDGTEIETGFDGVLNNATGYDLNALFLGMGENLGIPTSFTMRVVPRPPLMRNIAYLFEDVQKLGAAAQKLSLGKVRPIRVHLYDKESWSIVRKEELKGFSLEIAIGGSEALVAVEEKILDSLMEGNVGKRSDLRSVYDFEAVQYREVTKKLVGKATQFAFLADMLISPSKLSTTIDALRDLFKGAHQLGLFGCFASPSTFSLVPFARMKITRTERFNITRDLLELSHQNHGTLVANPLVQLLSKDQHMRHRFELARSIKGRIDRPNIINPARIFWTPT